MLAEKPVMKRDSLCPTYGYFEPLSCTSLTLTQEVFSVALLVFVLEEHCSREFCMKRLVTTCCLSSLRTGKETLHRSQQMRFLEHSVGGWWELSG